MSEEVKKTKTGPVVVQVEIEPGQQPLFFIELPKGAKFLQAFGAARRSKLVGTEPKLAVIMMYSADLAEDTVVEPRNVLLLSPGNWVEGVNLVGSAVSPIDNQIFAIGELPASEEQLAMYRAQKDKKPEVREAPPEVPSDVVDFLAKMRERGGRKPL